MWVSIVRPRGHLVFGKNEGRFWLRQRACCQIPAIMLSLIFGGLTTEAWAAPPEGKKVDPDAAYRSQIVPFLKKHCLECHGADAQEGDEGVPEFEGI